MRVRYLGEFARERRSYGCSRCGTGGSSSGSYETYKTRDRHYYNGRLVTFEKGQVVEVDDTLGRFLLSKKYQDQNGVTRPAYEEVHN